MNKLSYWFLILFLFMSLSVQAQTWIWFPGDFENWVGNQMNNRRNDRGTMVPVQWKLDGHEPLMVFSKEIDLDEPEEIEIYAEGKYNINLNWGRVKNGLEEGPTNKCTFLFKQNYFVEIYTYIPALIWPQKINFNEFNINN